MILPSTRQSGIRPRTTRGRSPNGADADQCNETAMGIRFLSGSIHGQSAKTGSTAVATILAHFCSGIYFAQTGPKALYCTQHMAKIWPNMEESYHVLQPALGTTV
jgi:hypothetical protein